MSDVVYQPHVFNMAKGLSEMVGTVCDKTDLPQEIKTRITQNIYDSVLCSYRLGFRMGEQDAHHKL